jgi:ribosomal protein S18 acetylase RimI-like enzyme
MQITAADREDCRALAVIHVESWQAAYASLLPAGYLASLSVADREESWTSILEVSASRTFIAKRDGRAVGFVTFGRCRDEGAGAQSGEVWALYVAPQAWASGVGWALWEAARVLMLHQGFTQVSLWVLSGNARGLRFYQSIGFRREPHPARFFERGGVKHAEVRLLFSGMSADPCIERTSSSGRLPPHTAAAHVDVRRREPHQ